MKRTSGASTFLLVAGIAVVGVVPVAGAAEDKPEVKLFPDDPEVVAARVNP